MKAQVGDVIRITKDRANGASVLAGETYIVKNVWGDEASVAIDGGWSISAANYRVIARAVKPDTGETLKEVAERYLRTWAAENPPKPKPVNRVLTMCEVYALPEGAEVWGEEREGRPIPSARHTRRGSRMEDVYGQYYDLDRAGWGTLGGRAIIRFWALPQPPTDAEKAANPW